MDFRELLDQPKFKKLLKIFAAIVGVILLATLIFFLATLGKIRVDVEYAPFAAKVSLDDATIWNHRVNYISPGNYHLKVELENFETYETDITVDSETRYIFGTLLPANEEGEKYMREHIKEFQHVEAIAGEVANLEGKKQREKFPIIDSLPIKEPYYTIGYTLSDSDHLAITVESSISYRDQAVARVLKFLSDEDFAKYDIIFKNLDNPFAGKFKENPEPDPEKFIKTGYKSLSGDPASFEVGSSTREGEYYYAYLRYFYKKYVGVVYRIVLKSSGGSWSLVADPYPLLTTANTPDVPLEIITAVNAL